MLAIKVDNIEKFFNKRIVVDNISFEVNEGEIFGLLGSNGAGKTTLMNMMTGLLTPDSGKISILGTDILKDIEYIRKKIAIVSQTISLYDALTVHENLEFFGSLYHNDNNFLKNKILEMLQVFHLDSV